MGLGLCFRGGVGVLFCKALYINVNLKVRNYDITASFSARKEQIQSAIEQDKLYEDHVRQAVDLMPNTSRSLSNISIQASPVVVSASTNCCISPSPQSDDLVQYYQRSNNQAYCLIL